MYVWSDIYFKFIELKETLCLKEKPETDFSGTVISTKNNSYVEIHNGEVLFYSADMKNLLPDIIIGLSAGQNNGNGWKIKGRIFNDSIDIRATNAISNVG